MLNSIDFAAQNRLKTKELLLLPWWEYVPSRGRLGETQEPEKERTERIISM